MFQILYQDEDLIVINKPTGILVHRTRISEDQVFVLQGLRDQIGQHIFPVHRIDRPTSGVLVFAKNKETASLLGLQLMANSIEKTYLAIIRGHLPENGVIDYALKKQNGEEQEALTQFKTLAQVELHLAINRYPTSRYSFVEARPKTGRWHQIRRHFAHLRHPIIGCKRHGDNKHNNYWREELDIGRLLLHAKTLTLEHPSGKKMTFEAPLNVGFLKALSVLKIEDKINNL